MKAIVLAAGKGTRLRPLTYGIPKPLLPVKGKPVIDWVIGNVLKCRDVDEVVVAISGASSEDFQERVMAHTHGICVDTYLKNLEYGVPIRTIQTPQRETGGDLRYVLEELNLKTGTVLVAYGDNVTSIDVKKMYDYHRKAGGVLGTTATLALFPAAKKDVPRLGIAGVKKQGGLYKIDKYLEKPELKDAPSNMAHAGYYFIDLDENFKLIPAKKIKLELSLFQELVRSQKIAAYIEKLPFWLDIGTVEAYELANKLAHKGLVIPPPKPNDSKR